MGTAERDLRTFYSPAEVRAAAEELRGDSEFQRDLRRMGTTLERRWKTQYPLKYLGIELGENGRHRFPLATAMRIAVRPRSMDGASRGLRLSSHRVAFVERFPDVDAALSLRRLFDAAPDADLASAPMFARSAYAALARPALEALEERIGLPPALSLEVLRKGLAAYHHGHRPGMSAHGWARARLTSFVMKGCTHWFPDHLLAKHAPAATQRFWRDLACLCRKRTQCGRYGTRTRANAAHSPATGVGAPARKTPESRTKGHSRSR